MRVRLRGSMSCVDWTLDSMLTAVRRNVRHGDRSHWAFESADLDGDAVLVIFRLANRSRFGVRYTLSDAPEGPNTGEPCDTPEDWAEEIWVDMEEQILTGGVARAEHSRRPGGLVLLAWT
jgi:hypothetical protein